MTPEQRSRQQIDRHLAQAGWLVQDHREINISAGLGGVAVREFPLMVKPEGHTLTGVETQSGKYLDGPSPVSQRGRSPTSPTRSNPTHAAPRSSACTAPVKTGGQRPTL